MIVLQIVLTSEESDLVNRHGWDGAQAISPRVRAYLNATFWGSSKWEPEFLSAYTVTGCILTNDPEEAFQAGNGYGEVRVIRNSRGRHSVSVGDILADADGRLWMVEPEGFKLVLARSRQWLHDMICARGEVLGAS